ncbi:bifunctional phosphopantothenoylcysteine decarboxylase/phosphopantothenate--cysteine ligase CoaBC [Timonella sp. A28]|uniref:bifunctional phosphopantothenoylcysteine decarboxylase/phosphopantothenate--cysteine ligase CoaBC n=1 Tax=Timonella sp. A28 TaxID=3442640 RepID=UPI003EBA6782
MRLVVGVSGGIAAYKIAFLVRAFKEAGHVVNVVPTQSSLNFVGVATWEALSGNPVHTSVFENVDRVEHVKLGQEADLVVIAPATADVIARIAAGRADDLLTATVLTATSPIIVVPAMHTEMWENQATQDNIATLKRRGIVVMEPAVGRLTGADSGKGRLPDPEDIVDFAFTVMAMKRDLQGRHVVISAGGTREPIDPVRFLGNNSSGLQGSALAQAALDRGAEVTVVGAAMTASLPERAAVRRVETALEMREELQALAPHADVIIMAAAVADFRPAQFSDSKIKKTQGTEPEPIQLVKNPDILAELVQQRNKKTHVIVGFAAETGDSTGGVLNHGQRKAQRKKADLLVVNEVGSGIGFGTAHNSVVVLDAQGQSIGSAHGTKLEVAHFILDNVNNLIQDRTSL